MMPRRKHGKGIKIDFFAPQDQEDLMIPSGAEHIPDPKPECQHPYKMLERNACGLWCKCGAHLEGPNDDV